MKRLIEKIDFLWKGHPDDLILMYLAISLAIVSLAELGLNIYYTFIK